MNKFSLLLILGILMLGNVALAQVKLTRLTIDMNGFSLGKEALLRGNGNTYTSETDSNGKVCFELPLNSASYFTLCIASSENLIYLLPQKKMNIILIPEIKYIDGKERKLFNLDKLNLKFTGEAASINDFINEYVIEEMPPESYLLSQCDYIKRIEQVIERNRQKIYQFDLDEQFKKHEYLKMKYHVLEAMTRYPIQHYWKGGSQLGVIYDHGEDMSTIHNYLLAEIKDDEELWKEKKYRIFFGSAIGTVTGIYGKKKLDKMFLARLGIATSLVKSQLILEDYVQELALNYIETTESSSLRSLQPVYEQYVKKQSYREALNKAMAAWEKSSTGTAFTKDESVYIDINGNTFNLASLKGKYVYIDVWATWCGPCRQELPHLKKLEEKFRGKNISFVSISIDNRLKDWIRMVKQNTMTGIQLYGGPQCPIMTDYQIEGIPRFFLIDREGKIIDANMTRSSEPRTEKTLNELEGI